MRWVSVSLEGLRRIDEDEGSKSERQREALSGIESGVRTPYCGRDDARPSSVSGFRAANFEVRTPVHPVLHERLASADVACPGDMLVVRPPHRMQAVCKKVRHAHQLFSTQRGRESQGKQRALLTPLPREPAEQDCLPSHVSQPGPLVLGVPKRLRRAIRRGRRYGRRGPDEGEESRGKEVGRRIILLQLEQSVSVDRARHEVVRPHLFDADHQSLATPFRGLEPAIHFVKDVLGPPPLRDKPVVRPQLAFVGEVEAEVEEADAERELGGEREGLAQRREQRVVEREAFLSGASSTSALLRQSVFPNARVVSEEATHVRAWQIQFVEHRRVGQGGHPATAGDAERVK